MADDDRGDEILEGILRWARETANVRALIMTGSRVRIGGRPDEFSDYDIELIAADTTPLTDNDAWLRSFAPVMVYLPLGEGQRYPTRLVFYENGVKVDFTIATRHRLLDFTQDGLDDLYQRGYKVLVDKDNMTAALPQPTGAFPRRAPPSPKEFHATVNEFWFEAAHIPRYLVREELWVVKFRDWTMKRMLLRMLEWHALARGGKAIDVWHIGSHGKDWLDPETWHGLEGVFGEFSAASSWQALLETVKLFRRLTLETAAILGYAEADETAEKVHTYIETFRDRLNTDER